MMGLGESGAGGGGAGVVGAEGIGGSGVSAMTSVPGRLASGQFFALFFEKFGKPLTAGISVL